jgi:adenosylcobinamide-GDP ribazoletransferase
MRSILVAAVFLTRVPFPIVPSAEEVSRATRWFPLVGALLGSVLAVLAGALTEVSRLSAAMDALLLVTVWAWMTGGIHLDGLADAADGFGGGRTREDVLCIMRDPRLGSFGVLALIFIVGLKAAALTSLLERRALVPVLIAAPTMARWSAVALGVWLPYARPEGGMGRVAARFRDLGGLAVATATAAFVSALALGFAAAALASITLLITAAVGGLARRRIGGVTGDVFGASMELTEAAVLIGAVLLTPQS